MQSGRRLDTATCNLGHPPTRSNLRAGVGDLVPEADAAGWRGHSNAVPQPSVVERIGSRKHENTEKAERRGPTLNG
jgi:hypothetical protein